MKKDEGKLFAFDNWLADDNVIRDFIKLTQISEVALDCGGQIYEHTQCCHEITYVVSGEGFLYTDDTAMLVHRGDIHVVSKDKRHRLIASPRENLRYICLGFDFTEIRHDFEPIASFYQNAPYFTISSEGDIRYLFEMLIREFYAHTSSEAFDSALESLIKLILIKVYRAFSANETEILPEDRRKGIGSTVYRITQYIDTNLYSVKTVREMAFALGFTENYLSHVFKNSMGVSLTSYIMKKRLEAARMLISYRTMSLTGISALLQFDSVQSLSRAFKREYGLSPSQYAKSDTIDMGTGGSGVDRKSGCNSGSTAKAEIDLESKEQKHGKKAVRKQ